MLKPVFKESNRPDPSCLSLYRVRQGDWVSKIVNRCYPEASSNVKEQLVNEIVLLNKSVIRHQDLIMPGSLIQLPDYSFRKLIPASKHDVSSTQSFVRQINNIWRFFPRKWQNMTEEHAAILMSMGISGNTMTYASGAGDELTKAANQISEIIAEYNKYTRSLTYGDPNTRETFLKTSQGKKKVLDKGFGRLLGKQHMMRITNRTRPMNVLNWGTQTKSKVISQLRTLRSNAGRFKWVGRTGYVLDLGLRAGNVAADWNTDNRYRTSLKELFGFGGGVTFGLGAGYILGGTVLGIACGPLIIFVLAIIGGGLAGYLGSMTGEWLGKAIYDIAEDFNGEPFYVYTLQ